MCTCTYKGKTETGDMRSWKADEKGHLGKSITCEHTIQPVGDTFGEAGDSGAAVFDKFGIFVGLDSASNTYTARASSRLQRACSLTSNGWLQRNK